MPELMERMEPILLVWLACIGACVGSFLNVVVFRLPRRCLSVFKPARSFCPLCRRQIKWQENIPMLSWLLLRARCAGCKEPIHWRYPLVELVTTVMFAWIAWRDLAGHMSEPQAWALFFVHATFASALLACTLIDFDFKIIPDEIDVPGILLAPFAVALVPAVMAHPPALSHTANALYGVLDAPFNWWGAGAVLEPLNALGAMPYTHPVGYVHLAGFVGGVIGAAAGAGFIFVVGELFSRILRQPAMGFGDVKYLGMIGGLLGWQGVVATVLFGCIAGSLGGVVHMVWSGRAEIRGADLEVERTPFGRLGLWITGARGPAASEQVVPIRLGTGVFARFATGDPYVPFGPFLSLGAFVALFWPQGLAAVLRAWSDLVARLVGG